ncbi:MAG: SDR family oxidoreductase [Chloroflexi bacterium]|nr:SDR family oxidoreductase [Chloroflexota bacterium]
MSGHADAQVVLQATGVLRVLLIGEPSSVIDATERAFLDAAGQVSIAAEPSSAMDADLVVGAAAFALGGLDAVVRWTPIPPPRSILTDSPGADDDRFVADIDRMLLGAQRVSLAAARVLARSGGGAIVLVGPIDASHAYPGRCSVAAAMAGMMGLARGLAVELAGDLVRTNVVLAGPMAAPDGDPDDDQAARTLLRSPRPTLVTAAEVAAAIVFVAGRSSAFMTGQSLRVDAGWASLNQAPDGMHFV